MLVFLMALTTSLILTALFLIMETMSKKTKNFLEKQTPFECGFNFFNLARTPFSMRFFLIAIIFIIFDIEIVIFLPLILTFWKSNIIKWTTLTIVFVIIILLGILMEWNENTFNWKD
uniref:NADH dehydrogenase subunit 3 n=1 Tax=Ayyaria chaetophora TaxID=1291247 RepID=UPI0030E2FC42